jgi:hypothetical protein
LRQARAAAVEAPHQLDITRQRRRQVGRRPQPRDAAFVLGVLLRVAPFERIAAGAGVGVDQREGFRLGRHRAQHLGEHQVLEHVGMVAGMESVAVGEHQFSRPCPRRPAARASAKAR